MLSEGAALAAALSMALLTFITAYGVSVYDNDFTDTDSWLWCIYAVTALATYLLGIAMALVRMNAIAYMTVSVALVSQSALVVWLLAMHKLRALPPEEAREQMLPASEPEHELERA